MQKVYGSDIEAGQGNQARGYTSKDNKATGQPRCAPEVSGLFVE